MISVVIPAFNEHEHIPNCLKSLANQDCTSKYEIIVVDNGSTDDTAAIAQSLAVRVISQPQRGIARARQTGFEAAAGDIIASTDADTILPADWLSRIEQLFNQNPEAVAVAGHFLLFDGPVVVRTAIKLSLKLMPLILKFAPRLWSFGGFNFAVRADAFTAIGGFNTNLVFGEDINLCHRLGKLGPIVYEPGLTVHSSGRSFSADRLGLKYLLVYLKFLTRREGQESTEQKPAKRDTNQHPNG